MQIPARLLPVSKSLDIGDFTSALQQLTRTYDDRSPVDRVLKAEILLYTGDANRAESFLARALDVRSAHLDIRARVLEHRGYIARHRGNIEEAIRLWEQSINLAERAKDLEQCSRSQLHLLAARADGHGPETLGTLPGDLRFNVIRTGNPYLWLTLHWRFAEIETRRSALQQAERHVKAGLSLLEKYQSSWMEARFYLLYGVISEGLSRPDSAIACFNRALDVARRSGYSFVETAALANLGHLYVSTNRLDMARTALADAQSKASNWPVLQFGVVHNIARLELAQGRDAVCETLLDSLPPLPGIPYMQIEGDLTRIRLLRKHGDLQRALDLVEAGVKVAADRSAHSLTCQFLLQKADLLLDLERPEDARVVLRSAHAICDRRSLRTVAELEGVQGRLSEVTGATNDGRAKRQRAARIAQFLGDIDTQTRMSSRGSLRTDGDETAEQTSKDQGGTRHLDGRVSVSHVLSSALSAIDFGVHPLLLGRELLSLIGELRDSVKRAALCEQHCQVHRVLEEMNGRAVPGGMGKSNDSVLCLGTVEETSYELIVEASQNCEGDQLLQLLSRFVGLSRELQEARRERAERASLWPKDIEVANTGPMFCGEKMLAVRQQALRMAATDLKVLITGETGVGKEIIARLIHGGSKRSAKRFEAVNCSSVPRELFEAHLFGHRKGAFTGAIADSPGVILANAGGTIFFDEIGELDKDMQVKLLRVLDVREIQPLGSPHSIPVDFRCIAATNANLHQLVEEDGFRDDLFYRLNVATLRVPPLRERREEILPFVQYFLTTFCAENDRPVPDVSDEASEYLLLYDWPGNIRELRNEMERVAGLIDPDTPVKVDDLKPEIVSARHAKQTNKVEGGPNEIVVRIDQPLERAYEEITRRAILSALERNKGNLEATAKDLGITRKGLYNKRLRFGMV